MISYLLIVGFFFVPNLSFADGVSGTCSENGYTVVTMNGVFTDEDGAKKNKEALELRLDREYRGENLKVDFLLNPSHLAGLGDLVMSAYQKIFDNEAVEDYDLVEMLKDASEKVKTQKLLLVAHSQGNFYANSFYDMVAGKEGGVPAESIGVYAVATPAGRVSGGGQWLTSDTDKIIADLVGSMPFKKIMPPNTSIILAKGDDSNGHNFSSVYLKHRGSEIVSSIQSSLGRLKENNVQKKESPCITPPELTLAHKVTGVVFAVVDPAANTSKDAIVVASSAVYQAGKTLAKGVYSLTNLIAGAGTSLLQEDEKPPVKTYSLWVLLADASNSQPATLTVTKPADLSADLDQNVQHSMSNIIDQDNLKQAEESLNNLQNQLLAWQTVPPSRRRLDGGTSSESSSMSRRSLDIEQPRFAAISPGFGGGGTGVASASSASSADSSSSSLPAEEAGSSSESSSSSSDTTPPVISSLAISECQQSLSSLPAEEAGGGCLVATTTLNIAWNSSADDLDYFIINNNGAVSATTSTSTSATVSDNAIFSFAISAKDSAGNFSATSTQTAEISTRPVVINEVAWAGTGATYPADEWIELYNRTSQAVNLSHWILYSKTDLGPYLNLSGTIAPRSYYLIENNTVSDIVADLTASFGNGLSNNGENLALVYKPTGQATTTIDEIPYDIYWYAGSNSNYATMERYSPDIAGTDASNWGTNNSIIINGHNAGGGNINGTPKARNSYNYLINKGQTVSSNLTLSASSSPYLVNNATQIFNASSTLTIEPGVVIKFYNDAGFSFSNGAKILAQGTSSNPVVFTSFYDDAYGGDTNGNAMATSPSAGNWFGLRINSPGAESIISNAVFRYGGKYYSGGGWTDSKANLYIANSSVVITNSVFEYSKVYGVRLSSASTTFSGNSFRYNNNSEEGNSTGLYVENSGTLTLNSNIFSNNKRGLYVLSAGSANINSNTFTSNSGEAIYSAGQLGSYSSNSGSNNSVNGIVINGNFTSTNSTTTLGVNSLPYVIKTYEATVVASSTLVIPSGVVLKADKRLNVNGNLNITGSSASDVILTSLYDDTVAGDTTNNGSTLPQAGNGGWISFSSTGSLVGSGFTARYGGNYASGGNNSAWLYFDGSGGSVSDALFDNNYPYGIYAASSPGLTITNTSFANHAFSGDWGTKAALAAFTSSTTLSTVSFLSNTLGVLSDTLSTFIVSGVTFTNNTATTSPGGLW